MLEDCWQAAHLAQKQLTHIISKVLQVRDFQAVIGRETRQQCLEKLGRDPDVLLACVGGGSNAIGLFHEFVDDAHVRLIGKLRLPAGQSCLRKHGALLELCISQWQ